MSDDFDRKAQRAIDRNPPPMPAAAVPDAPLPAAMVCPDAACGGVGQAGACHRCGAQMVAARTA